MSQRPPQQSQTRPWRVLDLFSGIGGFSLGLESVGMQTVAFCEQDGYARRVLKKHWPQAFIYDDVKTLTRQRIKADGLVPIDLICGGFPCQDISFAGKGAGIEGSRSGLWAEFARLVRELSPAWVISENVPALRDRGADRVIADLEKAGYTVESLVVGAIHAGAPHQRRRAWIVAHSNSKRKLLLSHQKTDILSSKFPEINKQLGYIWKRNAVGYRSKRVGWATKPRIRGSHDDVPARVDRLRCLGNAVVPQVVAMIGKAVLDTDRALQSQR